MLDGPVPPSHRVQLPRPEPTPIMIPARQKTHSMTFPLPASPLHRMKAAPSPILRRASPRFLAPQTKGVLKGALWMWFYVAVTGDESQSGRACAG